MKKRRLRYSELAAEPPKKEPRVSTPVELARALAAAREAEAKAVSTAVPSPAIGASEAKDPVPQAIPSALPKSDLPDRGDTARAEAELLMFAVGSERFALPITDVEEAVDLPTVHFVPEMPASMLGVISLRGALVPIYSPAQALGQPLVSRRAVLIFRLAGRAVGVAVDDVEDALVIADTELRELPLGERDDLVLGVVHHEGHIISVMRAASLVSACRGTRAVATS